MQITVSQLKTAMPNVASNITKNTWLKSYTVQQIVDLINKYSDDFAINTKLRMAHFLAQCAHESGELRYTEEIASGKAYEGRKDLGNTQKGDGVKFKGRGIIQLTGRANYTKYKAFCGYDVVSDPTLLSKPVGAIKSAMWFWKTHDLNKYADADNVLTITKKINGGTNGLTARKNYLTKAKKALGI